MEDSEIRARLKALVKERKLSEFSRSHGLARITLSWIANDVKNKRTGELRKIHPWHKEKIVQALKKWDKKEASK